MAVEGLQRYARKLIVVHAAATLFMVGLIWTIHYVHYPLFADVGESTYASFQTAHVERIGKLLFVPWLTEGITLLAISGIWSAPAHADLADGFEASIHDQLMTANLIRTLAWTVCGISAIWIVLATWSTDQTDMQHAK